MKSIAKQINVGLILPPLTEARLFPYLSLPMIYSFLKARGINIYQADWNIELSKSVFKKKHFASYKNEISKNKDLYHYFRYSLADYLENNTTTLYSEVFKTSSFKESSNTKHSIRLVRQGLDLLFENHFLASKVYNFDDFDKIINESDNIENKNSICKTFFKIVNNFICKKDIDLLAISIPFYSQILPSLLISKWVKQINPNVKIILGGQQLMLHSESVSKLKVYRKYIDFIGLGKGEDTIYELVRILSNQDEYKDYSQIPYLLFKDLNEKTQTSNGKSLLHLRDLAIPQYDGLNLHSYMSGDIQLSIITCIGCVWGRCVFCSYGNRSFMSNSYEQLSPTRIADICETLVKRHKIYRINFIDENTNLTLILNAMKILNRRKIKISFSTRNRMEEKLLNIDFCRELKDAGCILMSVGYETNSTRILNLLNKGVDADNYQQIIDNLHSVGINMRLSVMGGILDETNDEMINSFNFLLKNQHKIGIDIGQMLVAERNTILTNKYNDFPFDIQRDENLRGNEKLNFGMGRMGYSFTFTDGETFDSKLNTFIRLLRSINPQNNDELPPDMRSHITNIQASFTAIPRKFMLQEWAQIFEEDSRYIFLDLLWQRFYYLQIDNEYITIFKEGNRIIIENNGQSNNEYYDKLFTELNRLELIEN